MVEKDQMTTIAVVVGKLEVMLTQALAEILRIRNHVEANSSDIADLRGGHKAHEERIKALEDERVRRPTWPVVVMVIVGLVTLAVTLGAVDTVNRR